MPSVVKTEGIIECWIFQIQIKLFNCENVVRFS